MAAAGEAEGLRPRVAWACLATVVAAVLAVPFLQWPLHIYSRAPVDKEPAALQDRAREILARLGHATPVVDDASGLSFEAAAYSGRPVWFEIISPWTRPDRDEPFPVTEGQKAGRAWSCWSRD